MGKNTTNGWKWEVHVERRYGCMIHTKLRRAMIEKHGERNGWEPFGQWSMKKALEMAKKETIRLNSPEVMEAYLNLVRTTNDNNVDYDENEDQEDYESTTAAASSSCTSSDSNDNTATT